MKKVLVLTALITAGAIPAQAGIHLSIGIGRPAPTQVVVAPAPVYVPAPTPVLIAPTPVYSPPPTIVYAPPPSIYVPPPAVVVGPMPVYVRPPSIYFGASRGHYHHHRHFRGPRHGCR